MDAEDFGIKLPLRRSRPVSAAPYQSPTSQGDLVSNEIAEPEASSEYR